MPKPFDKSFKLLTEDDPRAVLALVAGIPPSAPLVVEALPHELNLESMQVDTLFRCREGAAEFLIHIESVTRFKRSALYLQLGYVQAIVSKYNLPCRSYLVLLTETGVPRRLPSLLRRVHGDMTVVLRLRPVRLWRIPASRVLRMNNPQFLPWVPLLKTNPAELEEAIRRLKAAQEPELSSHLAVFGGLRYGNKEAFLERLSEMLIKEEMLKESVTYEFIEEQGRKRGEAETLRKTISTLLLQRFGPLPASAKSRIKSAEAKDLNRWIRQVLSAASLSEAIK